MYEVELWFCASGSDGLIDLSRRCRLPFPPFRGLCIFDKDFDEGDTGPEIYTVVWVPDDKLLRCRTTKEVVEYLPNETTEDLARQFKEYGWKLDSVTLPIPLGPDETAAPLVV